MEKTPLLLKLEHVSHVFTQGSRTVTVLQDISYTFNQGMSYLLTGASGTGKSTLLYCLAGLETPTQGKVYLQDTDIFSLDAQKRAHILQKYIGFIFQVPHLIDELSLCENVMIKGLIAHDEYEEARKKAEELLMLVGLQGKENQRPRSLSGGEQQRVAIARALFTDPAFIIADEPTAHLDSKTAQGIMELLLSYQRDRQAGLIIASHDTSLINLVDIYLELRDGTLMSMAKKAQ